MDEQLLKIYERLPAFDLCMVQVDAARQPQAVQDTIAEAIRRRGGLPQLKSLLTEQESAMLIHAELQIAQDEFDAADSFSERLLLITKQMETLNAETLALVQASQAQRAADRARWKHTFFAILRGIPGTILGILLGSMLCAWLVQQAPELQMMVPLILTPICFGCVWLFSPKKDAFWFIMGFTVLAVCGAMLYGAYFG